MKEVKPKDVDMAILATKMDYIDKRLDTIETKIDTLKDDYVTQDEFDGHCHTINQKIAPLQKAYYAAIAAIVAIIAEAVAITISFIND